MSFVRQNMLLWHLMNNVLQKLCYAICATFLIGCVSTTETILPSLTFEQYSQQPVYVGSIDYDQSRLNVVKSDQERHLRDGVSQYIQSKFQIDVSKTSRVVIRTDVASVSHEYLKNEDHKYDLLSPWKSYDQYVFDAQLSVEVFCGGVSTKDLIHISKKTQIPSSYSVYERDLHLISFTEKYVADIDESIITNIRKCLT